MGPHGAYRGGPSLVCTSRHCALDVAPMPTGERAGKSANNRRPHSVTAISKSPVEQSCPDSPVVCGSRRATTGLWPVKGDVNNGVAISLKSRVWRGRRRPGSPFSWPRSKSP